MLPISQSEILLIYMIILALLTLRASFVYAKIIDPSQSISIFLVCGFLAGFGLLCSGKGIIHTIVLFTLFISCLSRFILIRRTLLVRDFQESDWVIIEEVSRVTSLSVDMSAHNIRCIVQEDLPAIGCLVFSRFLYMCIAGSDDTDNFPDFVKSSDWYISVNDFLEKNSIKGTDVKTWGISWIRKRPS